MKYLVEDKVPPTNVPVMDILPPQDNDPFSLDQELTAEEPLPVFGGY